MRKWVVPVLQNIPADNLGEPGFLVVYLVLYIQFVLDTLEKVHIQNEYWSIYSISLENTSSKSFVYEYEYNFSGT